MSLAFLPPFHAAVNATAAVVLVIAFIAVIKGHIALHRRMIMVAMGLSVLFLLSYVAYHFTHNEVKFGDLNLDGIVDDSERARVGGMRTFYLLLLISHIVLAAVSLPFILFTFIAGWTNRFNTHRRWPGGCFQCGSTWPSPAPSATGCSAPTTPEKRPGFSGGGATTARCPEDRAARCRVPES
jgi:uncharacterized membrane protein YozB (DUF420 family)